MSKYAKGRHAYGECQRSGKRVRYSELVEDGHIPGLLVARDWYEPEHPQETPPDMTDPVALYRPSPEISIHSDYAEPELGGQGTCAAAPDFATYVHTTTLDQSLSAGNTVIPLSEAAYYSFGQCIYIRRDDDTWFVSKSTSASLTPTYTVVLTTGVTLAGSGFSAGNIVYIGTDGNDLRGGKPHPPTPDPFTEDFEAYAVGTSLPDGAISGSTVTLGDFTYGAPDAFETPGNIADEDTSFPAVSFGEKVLRINGLYPFYIRRSDSEEWSLTEVIVGINDYELDATTHTLTIRGYAEADPDPDTDTALWTETFDVNSTTGNGVTYPVDQADVRSIYIVDGFTADDFYIFDFSGEAFAIE